MVRLVGGASLDGHQGLEDCGGGASGCRIIAVSDKLLTCFTTCSRPFTSCPPRAAADHSAAAGKGGDGRSAFGGGRQAFGARADATLLSEADGWLRRCS